MTSLVVLTLLLLAGSCTSQRIVGGSPTTVEQYPSIVQVEYGNGWFWHQGCSANIISNLFVLSAAHCFHVRFLPSYQRHTTRIRAGATFRSSGGVIINIVREFNHPSFLNTPGILFEGDITVVRLASPLTFGVGIQPTSIPPQNTVIPDNLSTVFAGWGTLWDGGPMSNVLLDVQVYTVNNVLCRERYLALPEHFREVVSPKMICAGVLNTGGRDACGGDSGGPLYYKDWTIGIISFGFQCATPTHPGVNIDVASYTNWIVEMVR